ncbi:MAG TPA: diphosphomevalonate decarboxylase [Polyangia bacterium]|nr:diphosphomevalonate decarboxylase [Polyangia bacterium]
MSRAVAVARTNIALVKYWGKRDNALNLPATGSLSLTLDGLETRTEVIFGGGEAPEGSQAPLDRLILAGVEETGVARTRVSRFLDLVRARAGRTERALVRSHNNFPTAAGLASSASAFAALALAATRAAGLVVPPAELSVLARRGSGSAARSIFGGLVEMHRGERADGSDAVAEPLAEWDLRLVVAVCGEGRKATLSTDGMRHTAETSPYFRAWVETHEADLTAARAAIRTRDLQALGEVMEYSCLKMHASALAARPGVIYWSGVTVEAFHLVRALRAGGTGVWFTNDAGPHAKALCAPADAPRVAEALAALPGVTRVITCAPGAGAQVIEEAAA